MRNGGVTLTGIAKNAAEVFLVTANQILKENTP